MALLWLDIAREPGLILPNIHRYANTGRVHFHVYLFIDLFCHCCHHYCYYDYLINIISMGRGREEEEEEKEGVWDVLELPCNGYSMCMCLCVCVCGLVGVINDLMDVLTACFCFLFLGLVLVLESDGGSQLVGTSESRDCSVSIICFVFRGC